MSFSIREIAESLKDREYTEHDLKMFMHQLKFIYEGYVDWLIETKKLTPPQAISELLHVHLNVMVNMLKASMFYVNQDNKMQCRKELDLTLDTIRSKIIKECL